MSNVVRKNLKFEKMRCPSCEELIKGEVSKIQGVEEIHADHTTQEGYVVYDHTKADINQILKAIESKKFSVRVVDSDSEENNDKYDANGNDSGEHEKKISSNVVRKDLEFDGMHCVSCEALIKSEVSKIVGVNEIHADYATQKGYVVYDKSRADINRILKAIKAKGYSVSVVDADSKESENNDDAEAENDEQDGDSDETNEGSSEENDDDSDEPEKESKYKNIVGITAMSLGLLVILALLMKIYGTLAIPELSANMSYGLIFVIGLFTGFHCIAMCGGFVVSYATKKGADGDTDHTPHLAYGAGKVLSYTVIGSLFGLLGGFIAFTTSIRAAVGIIAGLFLILFGLNSLNIFPSLRKFQLRMPAFISKRVNSEQSKHSSPFTIGLLNGLMIACGPLQAMYVFAAGTGSALEGAKIMFVFGLGTLPMLLGFGIFASKISSKTTRDIIKYSGILVIILGLIMLNRALVLQGGGYDAESIASKVGLLGAGTVQSNNAGNNAVKNPVTTGGNTVSNENFQTVRMDVTRNGYSPNRLSIKNGVPVKWIINVQQLTGCNRVLLMPAYNIRVNLVQGEQTVEFTPTKTGTISWSCGMGMLRGSFTVTD